LKYIFFVCFVFAMNESKAQLDSIWFNAGDLPNCDWGNTQHLGFFSNKYQKTVGYSIYLPPSYNKDFNKKYPVIYWLHGATGCERTDVGMSWHFYNKMEKENFPECIMVFPNGFYYSYWLNNYTSVAHNIDSVNVQDLFLKELIPFIDENYRTINDKYARAIIGFSMGGFGAMNAALQSGIFSSCICIDSGIWLENLESEGFKQSQNYDKEKISKNNIFKTLNNNIANAQNTYFYFITSSMGPAAQEQLSEVMKSLKIKHHFEIIAGLEHSPAPFFKKRGNKIIKEISSHFLLPENLNINPINNFEHLANATPKSTNIKSTTIWNKLSRLFIKD
jgi:predicted alpha/beta superfamily hydrolase